MFPAEPRRLAAVLLVAASALACSAKQRIALDCVPREVTVYVDGEPLDEVPSEIELRADQAHTLYFKGEGYRPQMVVLRSEEVDGETRLEPAEVCVELRAVGVRRELQVEIDSDEPTPGPRVAPDGAVELEERPDFQPH